MLLDQEISQPQFNGGGDRSSTGSDRPRIVRRQRLPSGRAVTGALLVVLAALGAFVAATSGDDDQGVEYLVAARDLTIGERLSASDLEWHRLSLTEPVARQAFTDSDTLLDAVLLSAVEPES